MVLSVRPGMVMVLLLHLMLSQPPRLLPLLHQPTLLLLHQWSIGPPLLFTSLLLWSINQLLPLLFTSLLLHLLFTSLLLPLLFTSLPLLYTSQPRPLLFTSLHPPLSL